MKLSMKLNTKTMTYTAFFAAITTVVGYFEFPLPFIPPFLKLDLSGAVILIGAFMFGAFPAVLMCAVKDLIQLLSTQTGGVGQLADFLMVSSMAIPAALIYRKIHTRKGALIGCAVGTASITIVSIFVNWFLLIPFYSQMMPLEAIFEACNKVNPAIKGLDGYLLFGVLPFNLIKGIVLSLITFLLYKRLSHFINTNRLSTALEKKNKKK